MTYMTPRQAEFFTRLGALCAEFEADIGGCGCCGSPEVGVAGGQFDYVAVNKDGAVTFNRQPLAEFVREPLKPEQG